MALRPEIGKCSMCSYRSNEEHRILQHTVRNHRFDPYFTVHCNVEGCGMSYKKWTSYKSHLNRKHGNITIQIEAEEIPVANIDADSGNIDENHEDGNIADNATADGGVHLPEEHGLEIMSPDEIRMWQAAKFLLDLRETSNISQSATNKVANGVEDLLINQCAVLKEQILKQADENGQVSSNLIIESFKSIEKRGLFSGIHTRHLLDSFLVESGQLILPDKVTLGQSLVWARKPRLRLVEKDITFYNVSFKSTLTQLLNQEDIFECVKNPIPFRKDGCLNTFSDGEYVKCHPLFGIDPEALMIVVYFDDIEISNPLGSKSKIHKLSMFYWTLGNIHPEYRSTLRAINLLAIVKTAHLRKYGANKVLEPFINEMKILESTNGMPIIIKGVLHNFRGSILFFTGDTLASNYVGGFKESPGFAQHPCRACMGSSTSIKESFVEEHFTPRTKQTYNDQCNDLEVENLTREARIFWSKTHGINQRSILYSLEYFDIITCMVQDLMHVVVEGCLEMECRYLITHCVSENAISLRELNDKLNCFDYGHVLKDKPSPIDAQHLDSKLRQNCAQTITLSNILPFLLYNKIPDNDDRLLNFILLLQIVNIMLAFKVKPGDVTLLQQMIERHHLQFRELYPNASIIPKLHFMIHMPKQILQFGPLRQQWCMRFEAAHCRIKHLASVVKNFKNPPFTMSYRYQALRCAQLLTLPGAPTRNFLYSGNFVNTGKSLKIGDHRFYEICMAKLNLTDANKLVLMSKEVESYGTKYRKGYAILKCDSEGTLPDFAIIEDIMVFGNRHLLIYKDMLTICYEKSLNAYEVEAKDTYGCVFLSELLHPHNISLHSLDGCSYIVLLNHRRTEF